MKNWLGRKLLRTGLNLLGVNPEHLVGFISTDFADPFLRGEWALNIKYDQNYGLTDLIILAPHTTEFNNVV